MHFYENLIKKNWMKINIICSFETSIEKILLYVFSTNKYTKTSL